MVLWTDALRRVRQYWERGHDGAWPSNIRRFVNNVALLGEPAWHPVNFRPRQSVALRTTLKHW